MVDLLRFFGFTYAITWTWWIGVAAFLPDTALTTVPGFRQFLFLPGTVTPALVALMFTARGGGWAGVRALVNRVLDWRVGAAWYGLAIGYGATIELTVALLYRGVTGAWPRFGEEAVYVMAAAIAISMWVQAGEEIGWRGYALPRLAERLGVGGASLVLGVIWASWHLPLFFIPGTSTTGQSFPVYLLQVTALSVAMAWLYWRVQGSLLLVMLMHAAVNNTRDIVPSAVIAGGDAFALRSSLVAWLTAATMWVAAIYFLVDMRGARLEPGSEGAGVST